MSQTPHSPALNASPAWEEYLEKNFKKLLFLCLALVVAAAAYGLVRYSNHAKAVKAGEAFASAKTVEDLDAVLQQHGGTLAAGNALLKKAELLWEQNKKTTSVDVLREFTEKNKSHPLYAQALLGLGSKLESLGKRSEAKPVFEQIISEFPTNDVAALAELRLGDILWADGKEDEAKKVYEGLAVKFPGSDAAILNQGETRGEWIAAKLPTKEVDGPPKPKEDKAAPAFSIPGAPQLKLNSADNKALSPTVTVPAPGSSTPSISLTPGGATSAPITVTPGAVMPAPAAPKVPTPPPAPAVPEVKAPAPAPAAPAVKVPVPAAPAAPATPAPAAPATAPAAPVKAP